MAAVRFVASVVLLLLALSWLAQVDAQTATVYSFCWAVQSASYSSFVSGILTINPQSVTVPGNSGSQQGYAVLSINGTRNFTDLTTGISNVSVIAGLMPPGSLGGNDNYLLLGSWPLLDGAGITVNFLSVPPMFGQYSAVNQTTQMNMRWAGASYSEQNQNSSRESAATSSSFTVAATSNPAVVPACQYYIQPLGWYADSTAQTQLAEGNQASNDLHCNPQQQFTALPAAGAFFESFNTFYDASSVSSTPVVRMALYQVLSPTTWTLLVGTQNGSDLQLTAGSTDGGTLATSTGPFYYPAGAALPVLIFPNASYVLCFSNNAGNISGAGAMFYWPQFGGLQNYALEPYYLTQPLPVSYPVSTALQSGVTDTWLIWMTVAAPGAGPATGGAPTPLPATAPDYDSSLCYGAYLVSPQNVTTFNYQYTLGCAPGGYSYGWQAPAGGSGCTSATNATGGSFMVVNITLVMLLSSKPVYGSGATTAFMICSLLPGSTRTVGTWVSAQTGLVWETTDLEIVQVPPGYGSAALGMGWNNWFYPFSASNGPNGPVSASPYGWQYFFDGYGVVYTLGRSWNGLTYMSLFTANIDGSPGETWVIPQGGTQLLEGAEQGPFGYVIEDSWKITMSTAAWYGCQSLPATTPTTTWTWNYGYTAVCNALFNYSGCTSAGSYTVNYTLIVQTVSTPIFDNGVNSPFVVCALLPGSTRTQTMNPTGSNPTTTTTAVSLGGLTSSSSWDFNNYFYPYSAINGANGQADGSLGLYFFMDNYGLVVNFATPQTIGTAQVNQINLCTSNGAATYGSQLMEELPTGQFGQIMNNQSWYASIAPGQTFAPGACPAAVGSQVVHLFSFNLVYQSQCSQSAGALLPGCYGGNSTAGWDRGYYTLNLTLNMITGVIPATGAGLVGPNSGYRACSLLPGSQRTTATSLTGGFPQVVTTPLTLLYNPNQNRYFTMNVPPSPGVYNFDNYFYPYSYTFGMYGGALNGNSNIDNEDNPNYYGAEFFFDNFGIVYAPSTPYLGQFPYINLCTSNPTAGSPNPLQLTEEVPGAALGVVSGWTVSVAMQRFAQQQSFYFAYSATGPLLVNTGTGAVTTPWATVINGIATVIVTSTPNVYQVIQVYATRSSTNFVTTVSGPISLVGTGLAGNNNNVLYVNSSQFPLGIDGSGWGYASNATALFPTAVSTSGSIAAGSSIQLVSGLVETANGQSTSYAGQLMTIVPYASSTTSPVATLPASATVVTFPVSGGGGSTSSASTASTGGVSTGGGAGASTGSSAPSGGGGVIYVNQTVTVPGSSSGSSLSNGQIAGIVIGCSIGLSLLCVICLLISQRALGSNGSSGKDRSDPIQHTRMPPSETSKVDQPDQAMRVRELEMQ